MWAALFTVGLNGMVERSDLGSVCERAVDVALGHFVEEGLQADEVGVSLIEIDRGAGGVRSGGYRGDEAMYPASVVKTFYLAYACHLVDQGALEWSEESQRAVRDMIVHSNNDATGYVIDWVCGTTPGPEISEEELREFGRKRQTVNRWFASLGYRKVNAVQRTYNEGPYGREAQWVGKTFANRNMLTPDASARLMADIALGRHWSKEQTAFMQELLKRANPADEPEKADAQARAYIGKVIPSGTLLYSKAGWTSEVRHDMAWLVMPEGREFALAVFTKRGRTMNLVSFLAAEVLKGLGYDVRDALAFVAEEDEA